ncbi:MAG: heparinase II/III family protein [Phycisphaerae bacterium]
MFDWSRKPAPAPASCETALRIALVGSLAEETEAELLRRLKEEAVCKARCTRTSDPGDQDVVIVGIAPDVSAGDAEIEAYCSAVRRALDARESDRRLVVWVSAPLQLDAVRAGGGSREALAAANATLSAECKARGATEVNLSSKFERWGRDRMIRPRGKTILTEAGAAATAGAVVKSICRWLPLHEIQGIDVPRLSGMSADELRSLLETDPAAADRALLEHLGWVDVPEPLGRHMPPESADQLLAGVVTFPNHPPVEIGPSPDWTMPGPDRNWQSCFLALDFLQMTVSALRKEFRPELLKQAEQLVLSFRRVNPPASPAVRRAWHEGTVAKRTANLLLFLPYYLRWLRQLPAPGASMAPQPGALAEMVAVIEQQAAYLACPAVYLPGGNHGLRQDLVLLLAAVALSGLAKSAEWKALALERLKSSQLGQIVSDEGVFLEHSAGYHFFGLSMFLGFRRVLEAGGEPVPRRLARTISGMLRFATHVLTPDGYMPPVGDTPSGRRPPRVSEAWTLPESAALRYSATVGHEGTVPDELDGFFPASGWALMRNTWLGQDDRTPAMQVNFHATLRSPRHKHADDLAVLLHGAGRWWLVDPGRYNYELADPYREFFRLSPAAHNTYTVDGEAYSLKPRPGGGVEMTGTFSSAELSAARAHNAQYRDARVQRTVVFVRALQVLLLVDRLQSGRTRRWRAHLNLAPDLHAVQDGLAVTASAEGCEWSLDVVGDGSWEALDVVCGQEDPILGWSSTGWQQKEPASVLVYETGGAERTAITAVHLRPADAEPLSEVSVEDAAESVRVSFRVAGRRWTTQVDDSAPGLRAWLEAADCAAGPDDDHDRYEADAGPEDEDDEE